MRLKHIILFLLLMITGSANAEGQLSNGRRLEPDNFHFIQWFGRTILNKDYAELRYTMEGFFMAFSGSSLSMQCEKSKDTYLGVIVDKGEMKKVRLDKVDVVLAENLDKDRLHFIQVYKLTEFQTGSVRIKSFDIKEGSIGINADLIYQNKIKFEFIGNSITCGYGNEGNYDAEHALTGFHPENENGYLAWGALATRNMEHSPLYSSVCYSGRGLIYNNDGSTKGLIPELYEEAITNGQQFNPNLIVVNAGTNDFFALGQGTVSFTMDEFSEAYRKFILKIREKYPEAKIVCVTGPMMNDSYPKGQNHLTKIIKATDKAVKGLKNVQRIDLTPQSAPFGEDFHPNLETHKKLSEEFIKKLKWEIINYDNMLLLHEKGEKFKLKFPKF